MKKRKIKGSVKFVFFVLFILICVLGYLMYKKTYSLNYYDAYLASSGEKIALYNEEYNKELELSRSTKILMTDKIYTNNEKEYYKIKYNDTEYYVLKDNIVSSKDETVKEKKLYVRTPVTIYKDSENVDIVGFIPKGEKVDILGFDELEDGIVNMYKISFGDTEGYVYSKYLLDNEEDAKKVYDEENTYSIHKDRKFSYELYGGYASELDYYPHEKANFKDNIMPDEVRTLYLNASVLNNIDEYIELAKSSNINAFVVDIYDGYLAYKSEISKDYSMSAYNSASMEVDKYKEVIKKIKDNNLYVIGRIVAFNNPHFAKDNPDEAISYNGKSTEWVSAFSRKAWEYNVKLAIEAVNLFGFNEIQYDYVRFPEASYRWSRNDYDFKNRYNESKGQAIQNFLLYASDKIHEAGAYLAADVFGESANTYVTAYGQYWPAISNVVDVISAMPYPDHFNKFEYGFKVAVWTKPYELLSKWGSSAAERQKEIPTPAKARTWIQAYDAIHEPKIVYDADKIDDQISALYSAGLKDGYITWNAASNITKYKSISSAFKKDYR